MKIITPETVTDAKLISSNVPENDHAEWASGTTYSRGDYAISLASHTVYRSLEDSNLGNDPDLEQAALADPLITDPLTVNWQIISATNRWMVFDEKPSVQAQNPESIEFVIAPGVFVGGIAGFNLLGTDLVIVGDVGGIGEVYRREVNLFEGSVVSDWSSYYFEELLAVTEFSLTDLPPYATAEWTVTLNNPGGVAKIGQIVLGKSSVLGETSVPGTGFTGLDFSFVQNDEFGNLTRVVRPSTKLADFEVVVPTRSLFALQERFRKLRGGAPAVWIGDGRAELSSIIYGFSRDHRVVYQSSPNSLLSIQIQGMV